MSYTADPLEAFSKDNSQGSCATTRSLFLVASVHNLRIKRPFLKVRHLLFEKMRGQMSVADAAMKRNVIRGMSMSNQNRIRSMPLSYAFRIMDPPDLTSSSLRSTQCAISEIVFSSHGIVCLVVTSII